MMTRFTMIIFSKVFDKYIQFVSQYTFLKIAEQFRTISLTRFDKINGTNRIISDTQNDVSNKINKKCHKSYSYTSVW